MLAKKVALTFVKLIIPMRASSTACLSAAVIGLRPVLDQAGAAAYKLPAIQPQLAETMRGICSIRRLLGISTSASLRGLCPVLPVTFVGADLLWHKMRGADRAPALKHRTSIEPPGQAASIDLGMPMAMGCVVRPGQDRREACGKVVASMMLCWV